MSSVVHLKRKGGKVVQDCDVYVGRRWTLGGWDLPESKWQNPFKVSEYGRDLALKKYEIYVRENDELWNSLEELEGKRLGCWCLPAPCHGQILLKLLEEKRKVGC